MNYLFGKNFVLKLLGISEIELFVIPNFKFLFNLFIRTVSIVQIFQFLTLFILIIENNSLRYLIISLIPTLFFVTRFMYYLSILSKIYEKIFIILIILFISMINFVLFLFYYFKDEIIIFNLGTPMYQSLELDFEQLINIIKSENIYVFFSVLILIFYQIIYLTPLLIFDKKVVKVYNQFINLNGELRKKRS